MKVSCTPPHGEQNWSLGMSKTPSCSLNLRFKAFEVPGPALTDGNAIFSGYMPTPQPETLWQKYTLLHLFRQIQPSNGWSGEN